MLRTNEHLTKEIQLYNQIVSRKAEAKYPATQAICTIPGVGPLTALTMVLILNNDPKRFGQSRDVRCYLGLRPGSGNPERVPHNWGSQKQATMCFAGL